MNDSDLTTRERILRAAMVRFSNGSYEDTGLRDIANVVRVDVSYVHRCFGSKKALFTEALTQALRDADFLSVNSNTLGEHLTANIHELRGDEGTSARAINIVMHSLSSREARPILRDAVTNGFIDPLLDNFAGITREKAILAIAILAGFGICSNVLHLDLFENSDNKEPEEQLAQEIRSIFPELATFLVERPRE